MSRRPPGPGWLDYGALGALAVSVILAIILAINLIFS